MLRRSHPQMYAWLVGHFGVPDTTPEHNRLQNRFLDDDFRLQLCLHLNPDEPAKLLRATVPGAVVNGWKAILPSRVQWAYSSASDAFGFETQTPPEEREPKRKASALESLRKDVGKIVVERMAPPGVNRPGL